MSDEGCSDHVNTLLSSFIAISPNDPSVANLIVDYYISLEGLKQNLGKYRN
jgi:hypothetical protein